MDLIESQRCERFKELRKSLNIKQGDFAKELAISQGHASDIENGRKSVSDRIIEILCLKYNVNENWLRNGKGEMFVPMTRDEQIEEFIGNVLRDEPGDFRKRLISALAKMSKEEWIVLEKRLNEIVTGK